MAALPYIAAMPASTAHYSWNDLFSQILRHRTLLIRANLVAILAAALSVPIPLLIPLLVDEVLLKKPGWLTTTMDKLFPADWHGPILYVLVITVLTMVLRLAWLFFPFGRPANLP